MFAAGTGRVEMPRYLLRRNASVTNGIMPQVELLERRATRRAAAQCLAQRLSLLL